MLGSRALPDVLGAHHLNGLALGPGGLLPEYVKAKNPWPHWAGRNLGWETG
jgi:hypothetical protein